MLAYFIPSLRPYLPLLEFPYFPPHWTLPLPTGYYLSHVSQPESTFPFSQKSYAGRCPHHLHNQLQAVHITAHLYHRSSSSAYHFFHPARLLYISRAPLLPFLFVSLCLATKSYHRILNFLLPVLSCMLVHFTSLSHNFLSLACCSTLAIPECRCWLLQVIPPEVLA